jgi:hypothetical protein
MYKSQLFVLLSCACKQKMKLGHSSDHCSGTHLDAEEQLNELVLFPTFIFIQPSALQYEHEPVIRGLEMLSKGVEIRKFRSKRRVRGSAGVRVDGLWLEARFNLPRSTHL